MSHLRNMRQPERTLEQAAEDLACEAFRRMDPEMFRRAMVLEQMAFRRRLRAIVKETQSC